MNTTPQPDFEELSIDTVAGLQAFLRNVQAQYDIGLKKETTAVTNGNAAYGDELQHAFLTVRHTTHKLIHNIQEGKQVEQEDAEKLQADYDELVRIVTSVQSKTASKAISEQKPGSDIPPTSNQHRAKSNQTKTHEAEPFRMSKPKTGVIKIDSEDSAVVDVKQQLTVKNTVPDSKRNARHQTDTGSVLTDPKERAKVKLVIEKSQRRFGDLKKKYKNPTLVQELLFEEAREGIEHLELLIKKPSFKKDKLLAVSEVAAHIKDALDTIADVGEGRKSSRVPFISQQTGASGAKTVSFVPTSVTTRRPGVVKRTIPKQLQTLPRPADVYQSESLTKKYLTSHRHLQFLQNHYSSPAGFEQILDATITKIEADTIDSIEKWLGDLPASAFAFLSDMSVREVITFSNRSYEEVTYDLQQQNIKYETFVAWRDLLNEMLDLVSGGENMNFGELFANWMFELAMQDAGNSQLSA